MSNETSASESWNVRGNAQKNEFTDNKAPIFKDNSGPVTINNYGLEGKTSLAGNPFVPPQPREGKLIGREKDLTRLHELLQSRKNVCVVSGMGGVGKTELVREYVDRKDCQEYFTGGVFYVDARSRGNMATDIVAVTQYHFQAQIADGLSDTQKVNQCWDTWKRKTQTEAVLLILDDVSGLAKNFKQYLPPADLGKLRLLITSRDTPDQRIAEELPLEVLLPGAAVALLASIIGKERVERETLAAEKLCEELGYLPLALELVGHYLNEDYQSLSLAAMRDKLKEKVKHPSLSPEEVPSLIAATRGIQAAFDLSWDELTPEAKYLACVLGAFASAAIHWVFVRGIYEILQGDAFSEDNLKDKWLKSLRKLHLVLTVETDIYDLHPLIRDYLAEQFKEHPQHNEIKQAFCDLSVIIVVEQSTTLADFNLIEPHLKKMIDWCEGNEDSRFAFNLNQLALLYDSQGKYNEAEPLFLRSLSIVEKQLGENHPNFASNLNNLAELYRNQGKYNEAEPLYLRSLAIREKQLGENHPDFAQSLNNLALLYKSQGKYEKAEPLHRRSLCIRENVFGENHPAVANSLNNLALLYNTQGKYDEAEPLYWRSLSIRENVLGKNHPAVATSLNNLAFLYDSQGKYNEAEPLYRRSLSIREKQLGDNHPDVAVSLNNLAFVYNAQGNYADAQKLSQQALTICQQKLGDRHPNTQNSLWATKLLNVQVLLDCDTQTLYGVLNFLAQQANLSDTDTNLMLLETIATNPQLLQSLREALHS